LFKFRQIARIHHPQKDVSVPLSSYERAAVVTRLAAIAETLKRIPENSPCSVNLERWRKLLEEKAKLETELDNEARNARASSAQPR
jgi:hypothetical protein